MAGGRVGDIGGGSLSFVLGLVSGLFPEACEGGDVSRCFFGGGGWVSIVCDFARGSALVTTLLFLCND